MCVYIHIYIYIYISHPVILIFFADFNVNVDLICPINCIPIKSIKHLVNLHEIKTLLLAKLS